MINYRFLGVITALAVGFILVTALVINGVNAVSEKVSHNKTKKALEASELKVKTASDERDNARLEAAEAKGRELMLAQNLELLKSKIGKAETKFVSAKKESNEARTNYEKTKKQIVITDNRSLDVKRNELRARLETRGIIVTQ